MTIETCDETESLEARATQSGDGRIVLRSIQNQTVAISLAAVSPLKLLAPKSRGKSAWIFASTYGGGLLGGDSIRIDVDAGENTRCLLSTQASTKIYRTEGAISRQELDVRLGQGAIVVAAPDPLTLFAGAKFEQRQRFDLSRGSGLVVIDWLTSGRRARGERWAFDLYSNRTEIFTTDDRCIFRDRVLLDPADGPIAGDMRMGRCDCFATMLVAGDAVKSHADQLLRDIAAEPVSIDTPLVVAASPIESGVVIRLASRDTESAAHWIRDRLEFVVELLGENPWSRKW